MGCGASKNKPDEVQANAPQKVPSEAAMTPIIPEAEAKPEDPQAQAVESPTPPQPEQYDDDEDDRESIASRPASAAPVDEPEEVEEAVEPEDPYEQQRRRQGGPMYPTQQQQEAALVAGVTGDKGLTDAASKAKEAARILEERLHEEERLRLEAEAAKQRSPPKQQSPAAAINGQFDSFLTQERKETEAQRELRLRREGEERRRMAIAEEESKRREVEDAKRYRVLQNELEREREVEERERLKQLREEAFQKDMDDFNDPSLVSFNVVFMEDNESSQMEETTGGKRKVFRFHLPRDSATLLDLKLAINMDFGYAFTQQRFYYKYRELDDETVLPDLPEWGDNAVLLFFPVGIPTSPPEHVFRPLQVQVGVDELMTMYSDTGKLSDDAGKTAYPRARNWLSELREILHLPRSSISEELDADRALADYCRSFEETAKYGIELIAKKDIMPVQTYELFGNGGEKYVCGGLLFRRVGDWELLGENVGEGDAAFKVAGHEFKGMQHLSALLLTNKFRLNAGSDYQYPVAEDEGEPSAELSNLYAPPTACIDHYGNRFIVMAVPPVEYDTLSYGSATDGLLIQTNDREATQIADVLGAKLNQKPHTVREQLSGLKPQLSLPYTVELHRSTEDQVSEVDYFVMSAARLCPPDVGSGKNQEKIDLLSKLLRPELTTKFGNPEEVEHGFHFFRVQNPRRCAISGDWINDYEYYYFAKRDYVVSAEAFEREPERSFEFPKNKMVRVEVPVEERMDYWMNVETGERRSQKPIIKRTLNSDAFCADQDPADRQQLEFAHAVLQNHVIPEFFQQINDHDVALDPPLTGADLTEEFHSRGINMRYLGRMAKEVQPNYLREMAVREMLARTIKTLIRDGLSFLQEYNEHDAKAIVLHYLNEIFTREETKDSVTVWKYIEELTLKKFHYQIEDNIRDKVYTVALLQAISSKMNIQLRSYRGYNFEDSHPFAIEDIESVNPFVHVSATNPFESRLVKRLWNEAKQLDAQGKRSVWYLEGGPEREQATERFREALQAAEHVYGPDSKITAQIFFDFAEQLESRHAEKGRPENSRWNQCALIPEDDFSRESELYYKKALAVFETIDRGMNYHAAWCKMALARLHNGPVQGLPDAAETMALVVRSRETKDDGGEKNKMLDGHPPVKLLSEAVSILEIVVGFSHPETAEAYQSLALLYQELNDCARASHWIRRAYVVFEQTFGKDHEVTRQCHQYLKYVEMRLDDQLDQCPTEDLPKKIEAIEFGQDTDTETDRSEMN